MSDGRRRRESGQAMVLVAFAFVALIGSAALALLAGSVELNRNQLQQLADATALDSALKIGVGCSAASANAVITEADNFLATQRTRSGALGIAAGTCATPYTGTDTFTGGLTATYHYPYRAHQQQVEVILTVNLPISFGSAVGSTTTTVTRRAVAQALPASVATVSATSLTCSSGQVNVAGSVYTQNLITRAGTCALYAHTRFDAASGTYSDLGNVSVYTDSQTWTAPGTCVAGSNAGSASAICADGYELSGHNTPACAGVTTSFLSAGDKVINANPCAAGTGALSVASLVTTLPPEPNQDASAIATLTGTGGAACSSAGVYPNITVSGTTVATGLAAIPIRDASGFYHFKPSCYGYINPSSLSGGRITNRQVGAEAGPVTKNIDLTLPAASLAGTLLVAVIKSETSPSNKPFTAPANWVQAATAFLDGAAHVDIWYYPNNPGGITTATFGASPASINIVGQMTEWSGVLAAAPLDRTGSATVGVAGKNASVSTSLANTRANDLVITNIGYSQQGAGNTYTRGASWNPLTNDTGNGFSSDYRTDLPAAIATENVTYTSDTTWALAIASFKPAAGGAGGSGAVLDPGFYYFNGSGMAGRVGGGICLNGGILLGRDVTLEFVNSTGFSSGSCAVGGGAACNAPCRFGSAPCSILACPPNAGADSPNNLTWFSAPCSAAAAGDAASCLGASSWCPAGDRSCWNELVWAPTTNTVGQIAIAGSNVNAWLLGSVDWPGTCTYQANGTSTIAGRVYCGTLSISAGVGAGTAVGSDYGINTAPAEAILVE
jgi:hypothetical protein